MTYMNEMRTTKKKEAENRLSTNFEKLIGRLPMSQVAVIPEGRGIPRSLDEFSFIPLTGNYETDSLERPGSNYTLPEGISVTYGVMAASRPYLDARFGIGLTRKNWLVAVAAAGIDDAGDIKIAQIQDVSGTSLKFSRHMRKEHYRTGLYDGFVWRDTLVASWVQTALESGVGNKLIVQSANNNDWLDRAPAEALVKGYDNVAERMGFAVGKNGDWEVELYANELAWPEPN